MRVNALVLLQTNSYPPNKIKTGVDAIIRVKNVRLRCDMVAKDAALRVIWRLISCHIKRKHPSKPQSIFNYIRVVKCSIATPIAQTAVNIRANVLHRVK